MKWGGSTFVVKIFRIGQHIAFRCDNRVIKGDNVYLVSKSHLIQISTDVHTNFPLKLS